jgi:hypothetical protein
MVSDPLRIPRGGVSRLGSSPGAVLAAATFRTGLTRRRAGSFNFTGFLSGDAEAVPFGDGLRRDFVAFSTFDRFRVEDPRVVVFSFDLDRRLVFLQNRLRDVRVVAGVICCVPLRRRLRRTGELLRGRIGRLAPLAQERRDGDRGKNAGNYSGVRLSNMRPSGGMRR